MRVLLIDNHDSFTAILHHYLWELAGDKPCLLRNDAATREALAALAADCGAAVLSPGPGRPERKRDFGLCRDLLELRPDLPVLGICLGHQGLAHFGGGRIVPVPDARHGRASHIRHRGEGIFRGLPQGFPAVRYHSLSVDAGSLPSPIQVTAWAEDDGQVMGLRYADRPWQGVQFHPESIGTGQGKALLANFLAEAVKRAPATYTVGRPTSSAPSPSESRVVREAAPALNWRPLPWREPDQAFRHHLAEVPTAFWLDGPGWGAACMGQAESLFALRDPEAFQRWQEPWAGRREREAPWPGYRGGPVGHFAYELHAWTLGSPPRLPDGILGRWLSPEGFLAFDREARQAYAAWEGISPPDWLRKAMADWEAEDLGAPARGGGLPPFAAWKPALGKEDYLARVRRLQAAIAAGETYEACLTHAFAASAEADPLEIYLALRQANPAPYAAYFRFPDLRLLSASPELFLELSAEGILRSRPIKGTRPRGRNPEEDARLRLDLGTHVKDRAENLMIVDLMRHDFCRVCSLGSVEVPALFQVEEHPALFQLVSEVQGRLDPDRSSLDAVWACFPGGSMTGAPKERTVEWLTAQESGPRGAYSGAFGFFTPGSFRLAMAIRTLENAGKAWRVGCGGAVLADSDPEAEWEEALLKARSVVDAASGPPTPSPAGPRPGSRAAG